VSSSDIFRTRPEDAELHPSGWGPLPGSDLEVTRLPLIDRAARLPTGEPMFARLSYREQLEVAASHGGSLLSMAEVLDIWRTGLRLTPVTLVTRPEHTAHMRGRSYCETHDARVYEQLRRAGWGGGQLVANACKDSIRGATAGRMRNGGWVQADGRPIQPGGPGSEHHDDDYTDYSQGLRLIRPRTSAPQPSSDGWASRLLTGAAGLLARAGGHLLQPRPLGERALDAAAEEHRRGVRELPGATHSKDIQRYHAGARRGGPPTAGLLGAQGGVLTLGAAASDETEWCASSASWCLAKVLRDGDTPPHGWRCSVRELVEDARALGTWRDISSGYEPALGDLAILRRVTGQDPRTGGQGHVARVSRRLEGGLYATLGGNEGNEWRYTMRAVDDGRTVGWVVYPRS
jgi:hypothetical protein